MSTTRVATALLSISVSLAACGSRVAVTNPNASSSSTAAGTSTTSGPIHRSATAAAKWTSLHASSYSFHYAMRCFCRPSVGYVTVTDGVVAGWKTDPREPGGPWHEDLPPLDALPTIDKLLSDAARAEREATGKVQVTYDPDTGVPIDASIDWDKNTLDDELGWTVSDFSVTTG
jgi:Family of unknown function (DUF6174)